MSHNPLLMEMLARQVRREYMAAAEIDRRIREAERQHVRPRRRLVAAMVGFLTAAMERRSVSRSVPSAR